MAYKSISVEITQEHFERSIKGSPREAIKELIWNACDADAQNIEVTFGYAGLPGAETVSDIYVKDDGHGIPVDCIEEYFGKYGLSRKWLRLLRCEEGYCGVRQHIQNCHVDAGYRL